jgi:hypothetical protein
MKKSVNKSNGYSSRKFFSFPKNGTIPASFTLPTPTNTAPTVCWSPVLKKYFFADTASSGKVYSQAPDGQKVLVHTYAGNWGSIHWSKTLQMLVLMTSTHIYTSTDGTVWTSQTIPASYAPDWSMSTFVDATSYLLAFGKEGSTGYMYKTTDGITWLRSASGTGGSTSVVAGAIGDTVGYSNNASGGSDTISYTSNGTSYSTVTGFGSSINFWPPTPIRPEFWFGTAGSATYRSVDGITYAYAGMDPQSSVGGSYYPAHFGGVMRYGYSTAFIGEYLSKSATTPAFVGKVSGYGTYPAETFVSIEGEYATYTNRTKAHKIGRWLGIGQFEVWLIGGGAPNANTSVGGTAGCMVIHRLTVTEKWRYCVYVYLGAAAIVDTLTGEFLAYASMLTSTSTSAQVNIAGFGSEVYPGLGSGGSWGAACGPSNGGPAFMSLSPTSSSKGCMTLATTTATTPPDWWCPMDFAGNPSGTGYPGTAGDTLATIGFMGGPTATTVTGSFGSGGCNTSAALTTVGADPIAIIYSR